MVWVRTESDDYNPKGMGIAFAALPADQLNLISDFVDRERKAAHTPLGSKIKFASRL